MGEQPIKGLISSEAQARMTVGEALSNLARNSPLLHLTSQNLIRISALGVCRNHPTERCEGVLQLDVVCAFSKKKIIVSLSL